MTTVLTPPGRAAAPPADQPAHSLIERIDRVLADFLDARAGFLTTVGPELQTVTATARHLVLDGGKRLRPSFAYWGWRTVNDADADDTGLLTAAAGLELLHGCALVHDDVMDDSARRRGHPAAHVNFAALHRDHHDRGDARRFGMSAAILIGDLLLTWADTLFATAQLPPGTLPATRAVYDQMRELVIAGQYLDLLAQSRGTFTAADALRVARLKTSTYTVTGPLRLGASAAAAPPDVLAALSAYGAAIGEAFQLRDDVLGVFGDPSLTGKPAGEDLRDGKCTLLVALALQTAAPADADLLRRTLGDRDLDDASVAALRELIIGTGALARVEQRITRRTTEARHALHTDAISDQARAALDLLAAAATQRRS